MLVRGKHTSILEDYFDTAEVAELQIEYATDFHQARASAQMSCPISSAGGLPFVNRG
jgi:hypothetical protein